MLFRSGRYELSELALATTSPFPDITPPANPQAESGYIIWRCARVSRAVGKGSQAVSNPPGKPRFGRPVPPGRPNLPHPEEVRQNTTHVCCRFANPLRKASFACSVSGPKQVAGPVVGWSLQFGYLWYGISGVTFSCNMWISGALRPSYPG